MPRKDKYACFQWIRDVRSKMSADDMEGMSPEERVAYSREEAEKALSAMPKLSLAEARRRRQAILYPEAGAAMPSRKPAGSGRRAGRRSGVKSVVHA